MIGQSIGHYKILDKLGAGGMGEVYRAEDITLERQIALKILPADLASDPDRLARFEREAKTLAALDHPNIVTIHTVEEADGIHFLTMQLVKGKRLSELIPRGGMPLERIFDIAIPLADALAAAHGKGVVHRDLKSSNIMVTGEKRVKILDFGLAKLRPDLHAGEATELATEPLTEEGRIIGTMPYMSPEQLEGREFDLRSDIFSLGVVLYEMATGERPFAGDTSVSLISSIFRDTPPAVDTLREELPHHLGRVVAHCLEKNPKRRYQSAIDVHNELSALKKEIDSGVVRPSSAEVAIIAPPRRRRWWPLVAALSGMLLLVIAGLALWQTLARSEPETPAPPVSEEALPKRKMIVVLPFENLGPPEDAYFAAGMTEEITSRLSAVSDLGVISRSSAVRYAGTDKSIQQIGEELGVEFVLEGTVRWAKGADGSRVRITPQLVRVADDTHLWSDRYDRELEDIFAVQAQVAQQVIALLEVTLRQPERQRLEIRPTANLEAYQAYLRGMANIRQSGGLVDQDWWTAEKMFERVTALDPGFALAHARLSHVRSVMLYSAGEENPSAWVPARRAAERALEIQPDLPEAHSALGHIHYWAERDYDRALERLTIAADGQPSDPDIRGSIAAIHRRRGEWEKAVAEFENALMLDPRSSSVAWELGTTFRFLRRYRQADEEYARSISLGPDQGGAYLSRADNRIQWTGDLQASRAILEEAPGRSFFSDVYWYAQLWLERDYEGILQRISEWGELGCLHCSQFSYIPRLYEAAALRALGDADRARAACDKARAELETAATEQPEVPGIRMTLAEAYAGLGLKDDAIREARLAVEIRPISEDALQGTALQWHLANIYVMVGEYDDALDLLDELLSIPSWLSVQWLRLDPTWDPLRDHPRFQALLERYG